MNELNVKVGDKVLLKYSYHCRDYEKIEEVVKVTPTGRIKINGVNVQFDKYGSQMGQRGFCSEFYQISSITEEEIIEFKERQRKNSLISKAYNLCHNINKENLTYEQALRIVEILNG